MHDFLEKNRKYGTIIAKKGLANLDLLHKLYAGQTAHSVGGGYSSALGRGPSRLSKTVEDLTVNEGNQGEGSGDSEGERETNINVHASDNESASPPRTVMQKTASTSTKRKSEETPESQQLKKRNAGFDAVVELLSAKKNDTNLAVRVNVALTQLGVADKRGDKFFVDAIKFLENEKHVRSFLALQNDNHKWLYLDWVDSISFNDQ